jgi:sulfur-oxidizing protein SoxX
MFRFQYILLTLLLIAMTGCDKGPDSPRGFSLPEGDESEGKLVFMKYQCLSCHTLEGVEDPDVVKELEKPILLGGTTTLIKTYAELVTSVINPSHKLAPRYINMGGEADGKSKMRVFNDVMTVTELTNLVSFLQPKYKVQPHQYTRYGQYHIP